MPQQWLDWKSKEVMQMQNVSQSLKSKMKNPYFEEYWQKIPWSCGLLAALMLGRIFQFEWFKSLEELLAFWITTWNDIIYRLFRDTKVKGLENVKEKNDLSDRMLHVRWYASNFDSWMTHCVTKSAGGENRQAHLCELTSLVPPNQTETQTTRTSWCTNSLTA